MANRTSVDRTRFLSHIEALGQEADLFAGLYQPVDAEDETIAGLRRRRRRAANEPDTVMKTVSLVEEDGTLYWRDGIPQQPSARHRRGRLRAEAPEGALVLAREFPALAPNKVVEAIGAIDRRLNTAIDLSLRSRLREVRQTPGGRFELQDATVAGPFAGRTLLFVHGTFSNAGNMLDEFTTHSARGRRFLTRAVQGADRYDRILCFEHPTLSVSPIINALELGRALAGSSGQIDVIAHSRGGLVVRWWLEAFGSSLRLDPAARVRAVLAGSPLNGTSLAAPDKIQHALSLVSNVGTFAQYALKLAGTANPFLWVGGKLVEVIVSVTGALAKTPIVDALAALVPGLAGQSRVSNNHEINRLRVGPVSVAPAYFAIVSNFETEDPGWRFWRNFRKDRVGDLASDVVFPGNNDLVVDTSSMTDFGVPGLALAGDACDFGTSATVWHCSYFREARSIDYIATQFGVTMA
jgi:pimeloyl-ACP methyl ester carboxylesterase